MISDLEMSDDAALDNNRTVYGLYDISCSWENIYLAKNLLVFEFKLCTPVFLSELLIVYQI